MIALYLLVAIWVGVPCIMGACLMLAPSATVTEDQPKVWAFHMPRIQALPSVAYVLVVAMACVVHTSAVYVTEGVFPSSDWCD